ncbi:MAG TPA: amidohydrolase family protein, partial [Stellaceae bacterium]|nr:amidohydrolase family protein [Stellaceae bacterium]
MAQPHRIDVHHHPSPPSYLNSRFERDKQYEPQKTWSVAKSIEDMDRGGVATAMLSLPHSVQIWPGKNDEARGLARDWNEFMAKMRADNPGRFGVFAALPILDIDGSLREIEYALDALKADGVALMTNIGDKWLGDAHYAPVFEELNRRGTILYTHPVAPNCCRDLLPELNDSVIEYGADTSRAIAKMIYGGAAARYPKMRVIF